MKKPVLYILCGLPFSGKTTLAKKLIRRLGANLVSLDQLVEQAGLPHVDTSIPEKVWKQFKRKSHFLIKNYLKNGQSVINDSVNLTKKDRQHLRLMATKYNSEVRVIYFETPLSLAKRRWKLNKRYQKRFDIPEYIFEDAAIKLETPTDEENFLIYKKSFNFADWYNTHFKTN